MYGLQHFEHTAALQPPGSVALHRRSGPGAGGGVNGYGMHWLTHPAHPIPLYTFDSPSQICVICLGHSAHVVLAMVLNIGGGFRFSAGHEHSVGCAALGVQFPVVMVPPCHEVPSQNTRE